jgi:hypothetical protein
MLYSRSLYKRHLTRLFHDNGSRQTGEPAAPAEKKARKKCPLPLAVDKGFHNLVHVLLEGGADINSVNMGWVFDTWDPTIMEFLIDQGTDVETGYPPAGYCAGKYGPPWGCLRGIRSGSPLPGADKHCLAPSL